MEQRLIAGVYKMTVNFIDSKTKKLIFSYEFSQTPPISLNDSVKIKDIRYGVEGIEWKISDQLIMEVYVRKL